MSRSVDVKSTVSPKALPSPGAYPQAALQRFTDGLDTTKNPEMKRFNEINKNRVQDFVKKPFDEAPLFHTAAHPAKPPPERQGFYDYEVKDNYVGVDSSHPELQRSLGNRSRFGDGDGSFWDKWVSTEAPTRGLGLDEHGLPVKGPSHAPSTGFKRLYMNRSVTKKARPLAKTTVEPYSVRRDKRLQQEAEDAERERQASSLPRLDGLSVKEDFVGSPALPKQPQPQQKRSPGKEDWRDVDLFEVDENGELLFNDAPLRLPPLTPLETTSYFGSKARFEFLEIFRQLSRQRYNFKDNKFMIFDSVIEEVESKAEAEGARKTKSKKRGKRFSSEMVDVAAWKAQSLSGGGQVHVPRSPVKQPRNLFQRKMSTEEDPIEVTGEIEQDVAALHLTLPKDGPAKFSRPLSPRHRFILGCINSRTTPRPSLLIRKDLSTLLNLEHQNMGDSGGVLLANALDGLPHLCSLNIADNNLTDEGLTAIIAKLPTCHYLTSLDISENKIDAEAAQQLSAYLLSPACALVDIVMRKSDVDDNEIGSFIQAIGQSNKLINVDLSANLIGSNQRTLKAGLTMGGKVLGEMLCDRSCKIETLKLAWNMIRYDSGVELMQSLKQNHSLLYLDVSYNSLGDEGAQSFGDAIQVNSTLQTILLSNNNISSSGCFCIVEGIKKCSSLVNVDLTNNPIGHRGAVSVMMAIIDVGDRVKIDIRGCSIARKDAACWYDPENPTGEHTLQLSRHYDRAVAIDLLKECAQSNGTYVVEGVRYTPDPKLDGRGAQNMALQCCQGPRFAVDELKRMPPKLVLDFHERECVRGQAAFLEQLTRICNEVIRDLPSTSKSHHDQYLHVLSNLQLDSDTLVTPVLTRNMTSAVLFKLGLGCYEWLLGQIFSALDPMGLRVVEVEQLKEFFVELFPHYAAMWSEAVKSGHGDCHYQFDGEEYVPNVIGSLQLQVRRNTEQIATKTMSTVKKVLTLENINNLLSSLKRTDNPYRMCEYALTNASLLFDEAWVMYKFMLNEMGDKSIVLSRLLPLMPNFYDARQLVNKVLGRDVSARVQLRQLMGPLYRVHTGSPTGFYCLHLNKAHDLSCLHKLFDFSRRAKHCRIKQMQLGDTSQCGDGHGFRNACLDGAPLVITEEWFSALPAKGKLEFDFFYVMKSPGLSAMSGLRFSQLLETMLLSPSAHQSHYEQLFDTSLPDPAPLHVNISEADIVSEFVHWCDENKSLRNSIVFPKHMTAGRADVSAGGGGDVPRRFSKSRDRPPSGFVATAFANIRVAPSSSHSTTSRAAVEHDTDSAVDLLKEMTQKALRTKIWTSEFMVEAIGNGNISCEQLVTLFREFRNVDDMLMFNDIQRKPFGTMQVEVLVQVFNQVSDPANITMVLKHFSPFDRAALIFRLGLLNVWSSLYPDGCYRLDLSKRDERQVLKVLITLSAADSQHEFSDVDFRADPQSKAMSPEDSAVAALFSKSCWKTDRSIPEAGVLRVSFRSEQTASSERKRRLPDSLHSEMLSLLYAPPLLLLPPSGAAKDSQAAARRARVQHDVPHSVKKTTILAANVGVKFNFELIKRSKIDQQEAQE